MEAVRTIMNINTLAPIINLPWKSENMQVEVIVLPVRKPIKKHITLDRTLKGRLKRYANPALLEKESSAWENHIAEKYAVT